MTPVKDYPIAPQANLPQSHVTISERENSCGCSSWLPLIAVGISSFLFLILVIAFGGDKLFPVSIDLYAGLVPIETKGFLQVLPFVKESNNSIGYSNFVKLPLQKAELDEYIKAFNDLLKDYPEKREKPYRNCWLENPTVDHPCYFDRSWITEICTRNNSYGYDIFRGEYTPCFILKFTDTQGWKPILPFYDSLMDESLGDASEHIDHGFIPVICKAQDESKPSVPIQVKVYPPKGFPLLYFPQSKFREPYLPPLVTVKVNGIRRNANVTVKCAIVTPNAFELKNNGRISVTFSASSGLF